LLYLHTIILTQFKNYPNAQFDFKERISGICGRNGAGKTNLLDAIYYCCFTKSYFTKTDSQNVHYGSSGFRIEARFELEEQPVNIVCILRETGRKEFLWQGEAYTKFASHIGRLPCVIIAPDDVQIITGGSEERRRFLDALLCQLDQAYLQRLMDYNKVLQQRNSLLKSVTAPDPGLLDVYDEQLALYGTYIHHMRNEFLKRFIPLVQAFYNQVAGTDEKVILNYDSQLEKASLRELLQLQRDRDRLLQRTNSGIHRDDINILLNVQPFKQVASQGQRKSLLFALKLAEFDTLKSDKGIPPLLLLDDVFEKLDAARMDNLLHWVCVHNKGQVFITDTHEERMRSHLDGLSVGYEVINVSCE